MADETTPAAEPEATPAAEPAKSDEAKKSIELNQIINQIFERRTKFVEQIRKIEQSNLSDAQKTQEMLIEEELLEQSIKKLSTFNNKEVKNLVSVLKQVIHDPTRTEKLKQFVNWNDKNNTWHTVLPEWAQYQGKLSS